MPTLEYIDDEWFGFTVTVSDGHGGSITSEEVWAEAFMMGDVNHDYAVDSSDTAAVTAAMGKHPGETGWDAAADLVNDQVINSADQDLVTVNMNRILDWYGSRIMDGSSTSEGASVRSQPDGPAIDRKLGPVDSDGLTFEQALQQVGLLDEWLEYQANQ